MSAKVPDDFFKNPVFRAVSLVCGVHHLTVAAIYQHMLLNSPARNLQDFTSITIAVDLFLSREEVESVLAGMQGHLLQGNTIVDIRPQHHTSTERVRQFRERQRLARSETRAETHETHKGNNETSNATNETLETTKGNAGTLDETNETQTGTPGLFLAKNDTSEPIQTALPLAYTRGLSLATPIESKKLEETSKEGEESKKRFNIWEEKRGYGGEEKPTFSEKSEQAKTPEQNPSPAKGKTKNPTPSPSPAAPPWWEDDDKKHTTPAGVARHLAGWKNRKGEFQWKHENITEADCADLLKRCAEYGATKRQVKDMMDEARDWYLGQNSKNVMPKSSILQWARKRIREWEAENKKLPSVAASEDTTFGLEKKARPDRSQQKVQTYEELESRFGKAKIESYCRDVDMRPAIANTDERKEFLVDYHNRTVMGELEFKAQIFWKESKWYGQTAV